MSDFRNNSIVTAIGYFRGTKKNPDAQRKINGITMFLIVQYLRNNTQGIWAGKNILIRISVRRFSLDGDNLDANWIL